ncbi:MAG: carboxylesterase family protein [Candidatus Omnitrophica bacterium]|nr:carboxylesterase family protein [Candidatus Omnitrophota bacterium]
MNQVKLDTGHIIGSKVNQAGREVYIYKGIPYAAPPVGELRWKPPQPAASWSDVRACTEFNVQAAQYPDPNGPGTMKSTTTSEDCLYLNVLTPTQNTNDKLPVMVWLHGGGLRYGNGNFPLSVNLGLPLHGAVQVNINHRLGVMGLLAHPLLTRESSQHASGDYMFLDMIAALQWVKRNIAAFGGDPNNVTIFGESGGGLKVAALIASPLANGLFHRAIIESGGRYFDSEPLKEMEAFGEKLFHKLGVDKEKDPLAAVRELPWETIINTDQELNMEMGPEYLFMGPWQVVHEGWFLPENLVDMFQNGRRNQVPYIVVANKGELTGPGSLIANMMIKDYLRLLTGQSTANSRGYAALFDQVPEGWKREGCVASHGMELHFVFGALDDTESWAASKGGYASSGAQSSIPMISNSDRVVAENILTIWTTFARTGNPSVKGLIEWPAWDEATDKYLLITDPLQIKQGYSDLMKIKPDTSKWTII